MSEAGGVTWFYRVDGSPAVYQQDKYLYDVTTSSCLYWQDGDWWFRMADGHASFWLKDQWVYTPDGKPAYYRT